MINLKKLSQKGLCEKLEVSPSTMNNWLKQNRNIPPEHLIPICEYLHVDLIWLLTGDTCKSVYPTNAESDKAKWKTQYEKLIYRNFIKLSEEQQQELINISALLLGVESSNPRASVSSILARSGKSKVIKTTRRARKPTSSISPIDEEVPKINMKVYDMPASAGKGDPLGDELYRIVAFNVDDVPTRANFGIRISGDSMTPKINNEDILWVAKQESVDDGEIGVFSFNNTAYCKKMKIDHKEKRQWLISLNPEYEPILIDEYDEFKIFGKILL